MVNILKEYNLIDKKNYKDIYNLYILVKGKYIAINDLRVKSEETPSLNGKIISSLEELDEYVKNDKCELWQKIGDDDFAVLIDKSDFDNIYETANLPSAGFLTDIYQGVTEDGNKTNFPNNLVRSLEIEKGNFSENEHVFCESYDGEITIYSKSDIGYVDDGKFISIASLGDSIDFDKLKDKVLYSQVDNKLITSIYTDVSVKFGKVLDVEKVNVNELSYHELNYDIDMSRDVTPKEDKKIDEYYSEHIAKKDADSATLDVYNYQASRTSSGEYIKLKLSGQNVETMVDINDLYFADDYGEKSNEKINPDIFKTEDRFNLIGKKIFVRTGVDKNNNDVFQSTEPLDIRQVGFSYDRMMAMQETTDNEDVLGKDSYIKLANGKYIKEQDLAHPIAYNIVKDTENFDAYYVKVTIGGSEQDLILDKSVFDKKMSFVYGNTTIDLKNAFKIKRSTKSLQDSDIIQTTKKGGKIEQCVALKIPKRNGSEIDTTTEVENKTELINGADSTFKEQYVKGEYVVDEVYLNDDKKDGQWVDINNGKRYLYTDHITIPDYSNDSAEYKYFKKGNVYYDGKKLNNDKFFDVSKANNAGYDKYAKLVGNGSIFLFSGAGVIGSAVLGSIISTILAVPASIVGVAMFAAIAGSFVLPPILIPIVNNIRGLIHNSHKKMYKNKLKLHRSQLNNEIVKDFELVYSNTLQAQKNAKKDKTVNNKFNKNNLLDKFEQIEQKIYSMSQGKLFSDFRMVEGKGKVDETNAEMFSVYRLEMLNLEREIKDLTKECKRDSSLQEELDYKKALYQQKLMSYVAQGIIEPKDENMNHLLKQSRVLKGYLLKRYFSEELTEDQAKFYDEIYNKYIKNGKLTIEEDKKFKSEKYNAELQSIKDVLAEFETIGQSTHYDYKENLIDQEKPTEIIDAEEVVEEKEEKTAEKAEEKTVEKTEEKEKIKNDIEKHNKERLEKLNQIYKDIGIDDKQINTNGSLKKTKENLELICESMENCTKLMRESKWDKERKAEISRLKLFIRHNQSTIVTLINERGGSKRQPKYMTNEFYERIITAHMNLAETFAKTGGVVNAKGEILTSEDLKEEALRSQLKKAGKQDTNVL